MRPSRTRSREGYRLYFPSRARMSPAFRAFLDVAREVTSEWP
ncbi:hypothetical protein [Corallococcus soli]|nr:hypothetical protein [Corallococcus soli]